MCARSGVLSIFKVKCVERKGLCSASDSLFSSFFFLLLCAGDNASAPRFNSFASQIRKGRKSVGKKHNPGECKMPVLLLVFLFITADKRNAPGVLRVSLSGCEAARIAVLILGHVSLTFTVKAKKSAVGYRPGAPLSKSRARRGAGRG